MNDGVQQIDLELKPYQQDLFDYYNKYYQQALNSTGVPMNQIIVKARRKGFISPLVRAIIQDRVEQRLNKKLLLII